MAEDDVEASGEETDPLLGRRINDRFRIIGGIARGGMGKVYRAIQEPLGREVAVKVLDPRYTGDSDPEFHRRFFLEAATCAKLSHPNTVTVFDYGKTDDDVYYIAMELLEGRTLHRLLKEDGALSPVRALSIAQQVCRSLREAHGLGLIHRDLKPANIYLVQHGDDEDFVKVLDFGLVKDLDSPDEMTQTGLFMGSPKYMSPEQIQGEMVDERTDVYSLGVILYQMLSGKVPFERNTSVNLLVAHLHDEPPALEERNPMVAIPGELSAVAYKALNKLPDERFDSMNEFLRALKRAGAAVGLRSANRSAELFAMSGSPSVSGPTFSGSLPPLPIPPEVRASAASVAPTPAHPMPTAAEPPSSRATWVLTAGAALLVGVLLAAGAAVLFRPGPEAVAEPAPAPTPTPSPPPAAAEPPPAPAPQTTVVNLESTPAGAMVEVNGETYGPTPTTVEWVGEDAERGRTVLFVFHLNDHQDYSARRVVLGNELTVSAPLSRLVAPEPTPRRPNRTKRPPRRRAPEASPPPPSEPPASPFRSDPYRENPY